MVKITQEQPVNCSEVTGIVYLIEHYNRLKLILELKLKQTFCDQNQSYTFIVYEAVSDLILDDITI